MTVTLGEVVTHDYVLAKAKELYDENYLLNPPELRPRFESQPLETKAVWFAKAAHLPIADSGYEAVSAKAKQLYEENSDSSLPQNSWKSLSLESRVEWLNKAEREMAADRRPARESAANQTPEDGDDTADDSDEFTP
jgi:hypothetical protein